MRLKRRLMVAVRLVTDGAECKPDASFPQICNSKKHLKSEASYSTGANMFRHELLTTERSNFLSSYED
jgi:hypothetical protein